MSGMGYTRLGNSGLVVSRLCLGTMTFTKGADWIPGVAKVDQAGASRMVDMALDAGVNFFDSADGYSAGEAEEMLGTALKGKRADAVICTKVGFRQSDRMTDAGLSRHHLRASVEGCLKRLGTDWIDLLVLHKTDFTTPLEETLGTLQTLIDHGKLRYIGVSNWPAWQVAQAVQFQRDNGLASFTAGQYLYNAANRDIEHDVLRMGAALGLGLMAWSPLAGGLLTGKYDLSDLEKVDGRLSEGDFLQIGAEQARAVLGALATAAEAHGATCAQVALAWILAKQRSHTVIFGASRESQLEKSLAAGAIHLREGEVAAIDAALPPARRYPEWFDDMMTDETYTKALT
ncbi:aldo/keto reductase [Cognatishimia sp. F0-27]|uniref:aldo/keto reductase n=1 Tax=Cognatishimia sp. F0-27 TaxID=2816855 RepID=UPI001D0C3A63|nr:aldo/keto reductase [Cognatishimia sp. F0-27]MCC1491171.1 aldo/keto reductase [Cognatishimia sp. F0-27]